MSFQVEEDIRNGYNCTTEAVPGAGKTHLLLNLSKTFHSCLILAYNNQLAVDISNQMTYTTTCMTFHSLCTKCIGPAKDDDQMSDWVLMAEQGLVKVTPLEKKVQLLLIDEAQDVRSLYIRLVKVCDLGEVQKCVVGDRNQLVYDFDDTFPASLDTLLRCNKLFPGAWQHHLLNESRRLTKPMVKLVNYMFETSITSEKEGRLIDVRSPKSIFDLYSVVEDVVEEDVLLLVDRKRGNAPLRTFLNDCSRRGISVSVHGVDEDPSTLHCATFWSAKGLQSRVVVVWLPKSAARNPTYVGLTRSFERLIVVLDPKEPHSGFCHAASNLPEACAFFDEHTRRVVEKGASKDASESFLNPPHFMSSATIGRNLDNFIPKRKRIKEEVETDILESTWQEVKSSGSVTLEMSCIAVQMCLIRCERMVNKTFTVRHIEDILHPTRLDSEQAAESIRKGLISRWVSRNVPENSLIASDLKRRIEASYERSKTRDGISASDLAILALGCQAWNSFDHIMRKHLPLDESAIAPIMPYVKWIDNVLFPSEFKWDTRLVNGSEHCRVHASNAICCIHIVWECSSNDEAAAALRASLHPNRECRLIELRNQRVRTMKANTSLSTED